MTVQDRGQAARTAHETRRKAARIAAIRRTGKWAVTMTKWKIAAATRRKSLRGRRWNVVGFTGPGGQESRGIVDLVAIRKDQRLPSDGSKRGDLFEMILIQVKGGSSDAPSAEDIARLRRVARRYNATVVLSTWKRAKTFTFEELKHPPNPKNPWKKLTDVSKVFR